MRIERRRIKGKISIVFDELVRFLISENYWMQSTVVVYSISMLVIPAVRRWETCVCQRWMSKSKDWRKETCQHYGPNRVFRPRWALWQVCRWQPYDVPLIISLSLSLGIVHWCSFSFFPLFFFLRGDIRHDCECIEHKRPRNNWRKKESEPCATNHELYTKQQTQEDWEEKKKDRKENDLHPTQSLMLGFNLSLPSKPSFFLSLTHPRPIVCPNKVGSFLPIRSLESSMICRLFNCVATTRSSDQRPCLFVYARTFAMPSNGSAAKENKRKRDEMGSNINCQWC
jgi:hypothetical protein